MDIVAVAEFVGEGGSRARAQVRGARTARRVTAPDSDGRKWADEGDGVYMLFGLFAGAEDSEAGSIFPCQQPGRERNIRSITEIQSCIGSRGMMACLSRYCGTILVNC